LYVKLSDLILKEIPGPHLEVMDTWPKWSNRGSPSVPGGLYPNEKYVPGYKPKERTKAQPVRAKEDTPKQQPAISASPGEGPTLVDKPVPAVTKEETQAIGDVPVQNQAIEESPAKAMLVDVPVNGQPEEIVDEEESVAEDSRVPNVEIPELAALVPQTDVEPPASPLGPEPLSPAVLPVQPEGGVVKGLLLPPPAAEAVDEIASVTTSSESLDLDAAMAEIKGLRPDLTTIGNAEKGVQSPAGIAKHLAIMGG
jgi:hypothetical protein